MANVNIHQRIFNETEGLPADALREILDFILFLKVRRLRHGAEHSFERQMTEELAELSSISLTHVEEEFAGYKEQYPREE